MNDRAALDRLLVHGPLVPVITIERIEDAVPLARALVTGGLRLLEITLRTPGASDAAKRIIAEVPDAIVGIGTVLTPDDLKRAADLGAQYALSPGATTELLDAAAAVSLPFIPGITTSSELMAALARGFDTVKFFPGGHRNSWPSAPMAAVASSISSRDHDRCGEVRLPHDPD